MGTELFQVFGLLGNAYMVGHVINDNQWGRAECDKMRQLMFKLSLAEETSDKNKLYRLELAWKAARDVFDITFERETQRELT